MRIGLVGSAGWRAATLTLVMALTALMAGPACADAAAGAGLTITDPAAEPAGAAAAVLPPTRGVMMDSMSQVFALRSAIEDVLAAGGNLPQLVEEALRAQSSAGSLDWLAGAALMMVIGLLASLAAERLFLRWAGAQFLTLYAEAPENRADKISYLIARTLIMAVGAAIFALVAVVAILVFDSGHKAARGAAFHALAAVAVFLVVRLLLFNLLAPDQPARRMVKLDDAEARGLYRELIAVVAVAAGLFLCSHLGVAYQLHEDAQTIWQISAALFGALALSVIALRYRRAVGRNIYDPEDAGGQAPGWRRLLARFWALLAASYFVAAWAISSSRMLLDMPSAAGLVTVPIWALLAGVVIYALLVLLIDRWILPRLDTPTAQAAIARDLAQAEITEGEIVDDAANAAQAQAEAIEMEAARSPYRALLDQGALIVTLAAALALVLWVWGVPLTDDRFFVANLFEVGLIVLAGYMAYRAVHIAIDNRMARERPEKEGQDEEMEIGGAGESRLATLLPLFRNFILITLVVLVGLVALSELGVNVAPLFAGAGVIGFAIGFGSQTLIRDIFSGAFFLFDDAFRKGEYIDIGSVKGTVEKISIRSMQLRHHNGPLNTVPFGEIKHVINYSRDWAMMKLAFRVTYDTDVEKVRKLIKKFGQQLLEDPEHGPKFLQPLKSQGVTALEDSAMIVRVKFMTKPGDQFALRKVVYAGIRDLFEREGIRFAHREVTVRVHQDPGGAPLSEEAQKAIGGAVLPLIDDQRGARTDQAESR